MRKKDFKLFAKAFGFSWRKDSNVSEILLIRGKNETKKLNCCFSDNGFFVQNSISGKWEVSRITINDLMESDIQSYKEYLESKHNEEVEEWENLTLSSKELGSQCNSEV